MSEEEKPKKTEEEFFLEVVDILMRYGAKRASRLAKIEKEKAAETEKDEQDQITSNIGE